MIISSLYAQPAPVGGTPSTAPAPSTQASAGAPAAPSLFSQIPFLLLFIGVFYFLLIRPQQRREKKRQEALKTISKGDKIVTRGGLVGIVQTVKTEEGLVSCKFGDAKIDVLLQAVEMVNPDANQVKKDGK